MCRHGLPLAIALTVLVAGCQNPWRSLGKHSFNEPGLDEPESLAEFPSAVADYPTEDGFPAARERSDEIQLIGFQDEETAAEETAPEEPPYFTRQELTKQLDKASDLLTESAEAEGEAQAELLSRASDLYAKVLKADPGNAVANHRLAVVADMQHDYQLAETHYKQALKRTPHNPDLLSDLGYSYQLQGRMDLSENYLRRALDISPGHRRAANNLGKLLAERGEYENAYAMFRRAGSKEHADQAIAWFFPDGPGSSPVSSTADAAKPVEQDKPADVGQAASVTPPGDRTNQSVVKTPPARTEPESPQPKDSGAKASAAEEDKMAEMFADFEPAARDTGPGSAVNVRPPGANTGSEPPLPPADPPLDDPLRAIRERVLLAEEELRKQFDDPIGVQPATNISMDSGRFGGPVIRPKSASPFGSASASPTDSTAGRVPQISGSATVAQTYSLPPKKSGGRIEVKPVTQQQPLPQWQDAPRDQNAGAAARQSQPATGAEVPVKKTAQGPHPDAAIEPWPGLRELDPAKRPIVRKEVQTTELPRGELPTYRPNPEPVRARYPDAAQGELPQINPGK